MCCSTPVHKWLHFSDVQNDIVCTAFEALRVCFEFVMYKMLRRHNI